MRAAHIICEAYIICPTRANIIEKSSLTAAFFWQGHKDLNPEPTVLETAALPIELYPYI